MIVRYLVSILITASVLLSDAGYVLVISFDGFRYDYVNWTDTPNFDYVAKQGVKAKGLIPVFPSLTFPNHYSIATGAYTETHNITGNIFFTQFNVVSKFNDR